jgi:endonuclease YncB( thermonuclease family)
MIQALALLSAALLAQGRVEAHGATVLSVGDGDSLRLLRGGAALKVRLACIDAPELRQRPQGPEARRQLQALLPPGSAVQLRRFATDRYGREVVELSDRGRNVNQALVARGAAFV